ncbi:MAG: hypothetical protein AVDCRST_MAG66-808, partial [uncultured Pseudonocardia sp.]
GRWGSDRRSRGGHRAGGPADRPGGLGGAGGAAGGRGAR